MNQELLQTNGGSGRREKWLREKHRRYMPGLDGLRAIAVFAVIFFHLGFPWASGGLLGVSIFFVLSGYLITDILISEWQERGTISLKVFWLRRARRLFPALYLTLILLLFWLILFRPSMLASFRLDALAAIFYVSNWWYIVHHLSYFESYANPSLLIHFWSLGVEEQFYLFWPLFMIFALRHPRVRRFLVVLTIGAAVLSAVWMAVLYQPGEDPSRIYYGTDTRAFSLLIGAALAMVLPSRKFTRMTLTRTKRLFLEAAGILALAVVVTTIALSNEYDGFVYQWGMFVLSLATAVVIAAAAHPSTWFGKIIGCFPLRWIGLRSYGMYLWQYPIIMLSLNNFDAGVPRLARYIVEIVLIIVVSTLSLELVENPFRSGAVGRFFRKNLLQKRRTARWRIIILTGSLLFLVVSSVSAWAQVRAQEARTANVQTVSKNIAGSSIRKPADSKDDQSNKGDSGNRTIKKPAGVNHHSTTTAKSAAKDSSGTAVKKPQPAKTPVAGGQAKTALAQKKISAIGDSIMVDVQPYLNKSFHHITISAQVGRHIEQAPAIVSQMKQNGTLGSAVIIELGTNGPVTSGQMAALVHQIGSGVQIIVTTTRVPRPWEDQVNQTMKKAASKYKNVHLADWYAASTGHSEFFAPDMIHLNPAGSKAFAALLYSTAAAAVK
jgi:peptidoglycan/LPS O-acetylase OafA/YrhL